MNSLVLPPLCPIIIVTSILLLRTEFFWLGGGRGWGGGGRLFMFEWEEEGWVLFRGWAFINFFYLSDGRLFEVDANLRLGVYSNKYGRHFSETQKKLHTNNVNVTGTKVTLLSGGLNIKNGHITTIQNQLKALSFLKSLSKF